MIKCLLVEDNPDDIKLIEVRLSKFSFIDALEICKTGEEALDLIAKTFKQDPGGMNLPDFIILDLKLPGIQGFEVLKILRTQYPFWDVPVVILTISDKLDDVVKGYKSGCVCFLNKSSSPELLAEVLGNLHVTNRFPRKPLKR